MYHITKLLRTNFALWAPGADIKKVDLILATVAAGSPMKVTYLEPQTLSQTKSGLWTLAASSSFIKPNVLHYYWFEVTVVVHRNTKKIRITDPFATTVDWRVLAKPEDPDASSEEFYPAGTTLWNGKELVVADTTPPDDEPKTLEAEAFPAGKLPENDQLVIYELPTAWMRSAKPGSRDNAVGTFADVISLLDSDAEAGNLPELTVTRPGYSYFSELGINAIELLPPADSIYPRQWGYGTTNFNAPDHELGFPETYTNPAPNRDLKRLVKAAHKLGIRCIADVVMGFGKSTPYKAIAWDSFFINPFDSSDTEPDIFDKFNSRGTRELRNPYGADAWRYAKKVYGYDPLSGEEKEIFPARQFLLACQERWMKDFHIDGFRLDSVENVANWDFVKEFKDHGHALHKQRFSSTLASNAEKTFLCIGEELSEPAALIAPNPTDGSVVLEGMWKENSKALIRHAILGQGHGDNLEWTIRKAIDSRIEGKYKTLTQAIIFVTSHDVEGMGNERLYNFLASHGLDTATIFRRSKLAFVMLLTAVGIPMILAGDEFGDEHDLFAKNPFDHKDERKAVTHEGGKQVDPVNFDRLKGDWNAWRRELLAYVSRLIKLRTSHPALRTNDTDFLYDNSDGKQVMTWVRGNAGFGKYVVVVANFSDYYNDNEYIVRNWPKVPEGTVWKEATGAREAPNAGREGIYGWEAKVYYN